MSRLERSQSSHLDAYALKSCESDQAISTFLGIVAACAGPNGKNQVIRNACGGHMTITSSCWRLLSSMTVSRTELKFVVSAIMGHLKEYCDCGLFMAYFVLRLVKTCVRTGISHITINSLLHYFVSSVISYLSLDPCDVVVKVDFSNVKVLLAYVRSILTSKTLLNMQQTDCNSLNHLIVKTFVDAIPSVPQKRHSDGMFVLGIENQPVSSSKALEGILLACPEISNCGDPVELHIKTDFESENTRETQSIIKVVLITCSMSGDVEEMVKSSFEATDQQLNEIDEVVMKGMMAFCDCLRAENVGIILCQKVIHPCIKTTLKSQGIFFVDRLGSQVIPYLRDLTGCVPVSTLMLVKSQLLNCIGKLTSVTHCIEGSRSYLLLDNSPSSIVSLIVCGEWDERVSELKNCVNTCLQGLSLLAKEPKFLKGGGCWQMNCSAALEKQIFADLPKILEEYSCSEADLRHMLSSFVSSLRGWCLQLKSEQEHLSFDQHSGHAWRVAKGMSDVTCSNQGMLQCCCGFKSIPIYCLHDMDIVLDGHSLLHPVKERNILESHVEDNIDYGHGVVLDSLTTAVQALNKSAATAGMLLSVGYFIRDVN